MTRSMRSFLVCLWLLPALSACAGYEFVAAPTPICTPTRVPTDTSTPAWWKGEQIPGTPTPDILGTATPGPTRSAGISTATMVPGTRVPTATPVSYAGKILFVSDQETNFFGDGTLWMMNPDGTVRAKMPDPGQYERALEANTWDAGHTRRAYVGSNLQIWIEFPQDKSRWQVTKVGNGICYDPSFSNDGRITFVSNENNQGDDVYIINADGSGQKRLTYNEWPWDKFPSFSPDSTQIVFWSNRDGHKQIWVMDAGGGNQRNISNSPHNDWNPVWVR